MTGYCVNRDGNPVNDLKVCGPCVKRFHTALVSIGETSPVLLLIAMRETHTGDRDRTGIRGKSPHARLPIREQAWELYCETEGLMRLAALQCGHSPASRETASIPELARTILKDDSPLLAASDACEWWRDVIDIARKISLTVDPPATRVMFGACPFCRNGTIWGEPRARMGTCKTCGSEVRRTYIPNRLLDRLSASDRTGTPSQLSRECARAGVRLPAATIRTWIHQKRLTPDERGHVALSDIVPLLRKRSR